MKGPSPIECPRCKRFDFCQSLISRFDGSAKFYVCHECFKAWTKWHDRTIGEFMVSNIIFDDVL